MSTRHLSELCKNTDVAQVKERLLELCPERRASEMNGLDDEFINNKGSADDNGNDDNKFTQEMDAQMHATFSGIWAYQDDDGRTALHWSIAMLNFPLARTLLAAPYYSLADSVDQDGASPFVTACVVGAPETLFMEVLHCASKQRRWRLYHEKKSASSNNNNNNNHNDNNPHPTTSTGNEQNNENANDKGDGNGSDREEDELMLHRREIVNQPDAQGNTPLLHAASRGRIDLLRSLVQLGADILWQNRRGQTALHRAVGRGAMNLVEELVHISNKQHNNATHRKWMNAADCRGDTALFYASCDENEELGRYLLQHGADRNVRNKEGKEFWEM